ncbi:MAG: hypothetical protein E7299_07145 [Lachnospiraceae bacterium]|nr:hypothetical protein [Lachnospiraceae bacterium]
MNNEILFAKTLEAVRKKAREQGNVISKQQVEEAFSVLALEESQLLLVYDYLKKNKIGIDENIDLDEYLSEEEKDYLKEYLEVLNQIEEVSDGEKEAYFLSAMAGEKGAQQRLIELFLPKVAEIAKLYSGQGVYLEDLIGQGNMALSEGVTMLACEESAAGAEGLLVRMIMDSMEELIADDIEVHQADRKLEEKVNFLAEKAKELAEEFRRNVTVKELSEELELSEDEIWEIYQMSGYAIEDIDAEGRK